MLCEFERLSCTQVNCPILTSLSTDYFTHLLSLLSLIFILKKAVRLSPTVLGDYVNQMQLLLAGCDHVAVSCDGPLEVASSFEIRSAE